MRYEKYLTKGQLIKKVAAFFRKDSFAGVLLVLISICALIIANSPWLHWYELLIQSKFYIGINDLKLSKPLLLWINDGLMAIYFLVIGLELKREILEGHLSKISQIFLPAAAAIGGIIVPAGIYFIFNHHDKSLIDGWTIPTATDIAFSLGVLALLGTRIPPSLKIFLMTVAIFDDFAAIIIIAALYTSNLSSISLMLAGMAIALLIILNRLNITLISIYLVIGIFLWFFVLKSGVHATLAGVILAFTIPSRITKGGIIFSPLKIVEHGLHAWVTFFIIPLFAFSNAGINFSGISPKDILSPMTIGIALGLFLGKQLGIFSMSFLLIRLKIAPMPPNTNWYQIYGIAVLGGIGFTMSLFISSLAFENSSPEFTILSRVGIFAGSIASAILGYFILKCSTKIN